MTLCPFGKIQHATREAALEHQKRLVWKNHLAGQAEKSKGLNVYPCPSCSDWHVGHSTDGTMPLVYHYTVGMYLDRIQRALRPRSPKAPSAAINEPKPLLWFSWNAVWEQSVTKDPRPPSLRVSPPTGRAVTECAADGLIRFGAPASVAKLRWNDYLALNYTPSVVRESMAQRGNPVEWLATDQPVLLTECRAFEVYYQGRWVNGATVSDEEFKAYLDGRPAAYAAAGKRLNAKMRGKEVVLLQQLQPEDEAEAILREDYLTFFREEDFKLAHTDELERVQRKFLWRLQRRGR